jgi:hypothetical protein
MLDRVFHGFDALKVLLVHVVQEAGNTTWLVTEMLRKTYE